MNQNTFTDLSKIAKHLVLSSSVTERENLRLEIAALSPQQLYKYRNYLHI